MTTIKIFNDGHFREVVGTYLMDYGHQVDLNHLDVSLVTDMSHLFHNIPFTGDISRWDTSNVIDMQHMFSGSIFNGDISQWDVSKVQNMRAMFSSSSFNGDISKWDTSNVSNMSFLFQNSSFSGDVSAWNTSNVEYMHYLFYQTTSVHDISKWDTSKVKDMREMFLGCNIASQLDQWNLSSLDAKKASRIFSQFHESPLGYIGVLLGEYPFPSQELEASAFDTLRSICEGLAMNTVKAAQLIYQELHPTEPEMSLPTDFESEAFGI